MAFWPQNSLTVTGGHWRSNRSQIWKIDQGTQLLAWILIWYPWPTRTRVFGPQMSLEVSWGQKEVKFEKTHTRMQCLACVLIWYPWVTKVISFWPQWLYRYAKSLAYPQDSRISLWPLAVKKGLLTTQKKVVKNIKISKTWQHCFFAAQTQNVVHHLFLYYYLTPRAAITESQGPGMYTLRIYIYIVIQKEDEKLTCYYQ